MLTPSRSAVARWVLAAVLLLFVLGRHYGTWDERSWDATSSPPDAFLNFAIFICVLILVVYEAAPWLAERISLHFVEVYFPRLSFPRPPLSYTLAHHYRDQGRLEEAAEEYRKIIRYYPTEEAAYVELLELAEQMGDARMGGRYAALYFRRFGQGQGQSGAVAAK